MTPTDYWDGWYAVSSIAAVVGYVVVAAGVVSALAIWSWLTKD